MKKIIVIDDSLIILRTVEELLRKAGFEVLKAEDGLAGLDLIKKNTDCDLIIVDLNMPKMGGFEMLDEMYEEEICIDRPVIIFTTESIVVKENALKVREKNKSTGRKTWYVKPLTEERYENFLDTVNAMLESD
ncbi:MAG: response regulator [Bdellovibrionota bacterium]|nr:response regulator [Bdellovibrionota bacterium]